jgi:RNA polymerase sigma-70 factor, ECF subfamily
VADELESQLEPPTVPSLEGEHSPRRERIEPPARAVLEAARRRDPAALGAFFDLYFDHVHSFAARVLGNRAAAEDMAQEVFLKIHRSIDRLDPTRDPWPWLATIVQNACRDRWRSGADRMARRSDSIDGDRAAAERLVAGGEGPEAHASARERERLVRDAIAMLPEAQKEMVLLFDYAGLSHVEVAEALGISHAAARKRYSRALEELGRILRRTTGDMR